MRAGIVIWLAAIAFLVGALLGTLWSRDIDKELRNTVPAEEVHA